MALTYSYDPAANKITVSGSGTFALANLATADRANSLTLKAATPPALGITLTYQIKPAEKLALPITFVLAGTNAGAGCTLDLTGTDAWGTAQTESISVAAGNGTYVSTKRFRTITSFSCTGFSDGVGTVTVTQAQWGVIWALNALTYIMDCYLTVGDGSNAATLAEYTNSLICTTNARKIAVEAASIARFGQVATAPASYRGVLISFAYDYSGYIFDIAGTLYLDNCAVRGPLSGSNTGYITERGSTSGAVYIRNCVLINRIAPCNVKNGQVFNTYSGVSGGEALQDCTSISQFTAGKPSQGLITYATLDFTVPDLTIQSLPAPNVLVMGMNSTAVVTLLDCVTPAWRFSLSPAPMKVIRAHRLSLHVTDSAGVGIDGATVILKQADGTVVINTTTVEGGKIKDGANYYFAVSRGYYTAATGDTLQDYGPHILTITAPGKADYQDIIALDRKLDLEVALKPVGQPAAAWEFTHV